MQMGKEYSLLIFAILLGLLLLVQAVGGNFVSKGKGCIAVVLSKQDGEISDLNTPRKISEQQFYRISKVAFPEGDLLKHKDLGELPYGQNYYLDLTTEFNVVRAGDFEFRVSSDDGFRFYIDDVVKFEYISPRRFAISKVNIPLTEGKHRLKLEYFQQGGQVGLEATYKEKSEKTIHFIGQSSPWIKFIE